MKTVLSFTLSGNIASVSEALRRFRRYWPQSLRRVTLYQEPIVRIEMWEWGGEPSAMLSAAFSGTVTADDISQLEQGSRRFGWCESRMSGWDDHYRVTISDFSVRHVDEPAPRLVWNQDAADINWESVRPRWEDIYLHAPARYGITEGWAARAVGDWLQAPLEIVFRLYGSRRRREAALQSVQHELAGTLTTLRDTRDWSELRLEMDTLDRPHEVLNRAFRDRFNVTPNLEGPPPRWRRNQGRLHIFESEELRLTLEIVSVNGENIHARNHNRWGMTEEGASRLLRQAFGQDFVHSDRAKTAREREEAEQRALSLLEKELHLDQLLSYQRYGYIVVVSASGNTYTIFGEEDKRVQLNRPGLPVVELCIAPSNWVPAADRVLTHKLLIEGDEEAYLREANWFSSAGSQIHNPYREQVRREWVYATGVTEDTRTMSDMVNGILQNCMDRAGLQENPELISTLPHTNWMDRILGYELHPAQQVVSWDRAIRTITAR